MKDSVMIIKQNRPIAKDIYEMVLETGSHEGVEQIKPGQFVNIRVEGFYLRRPISICDWNEDEDTITIAYKTVGAGTKKMASMRAGEKLDVLWPLGHGFDIDAAAEAVGKRGAGSASGARCLLIGGGVGVPPMVALCRKLTEAGAKATAVLGFRTSDEVIYEKKLIDMGADVFLVTEDGSAGKRGYVTEAITDCDIFFACGPEAMLKALCEEMPEGIPGQLSFEERMGCGFGACMGCSCKTRYGSKRICKEGPVLRREEIVW